MSTGLIVLIVVIVVAVYFGMAYNAFITLKNRVKEAWSDIEVQMKRRYDLIPNMAMAQHGSMKEVAQSENILSGALKSLFALKESYPDLKANQNFLELQRELRDTEDKLQAARRFYNGNVMNLNNKVEMFPSNIIAGMFHFEKAEFFELAEGEQEARQAVKVKF